MTIQRSDYGCGDNSCIFGSTGGMGTNGGCRCLSEMPHRAVDARRRVTRGIMALRERLAEDAKVRAQLVATLESIATVSWRNFDAELQDPQSFVDWAKSIANAALAAAKERA